MQEGDLLIHGVFFGNQCGNLTGVGVVLGLDAVDLRLNDGVFHLQIRNLLFDFRGGGGGGGQGNGGQDQGKCQDHSQRRSE